MPGECTGYADCDEIGDLGLCYDCGCEWDYGSCFGEIDCEFLDEYDCEDCGCQWIEAPVMGETVKLNIANVWRSVDEMKINISNAWRTVEEIHVNVGGVWRNVY